VQHNPWKGVHHAPSHHDSDKKTKCETTTENAPVLELGEAVVEGDGPEEEAGGKRVGIPAA
jgi:hypothetical protein